MEDVRSLLFELELDDNFDSDINDIVRAVASIVLRLIYTVRLCRIRQAYDRPTT